MDEEKTVSSTAIGIISKSKSNIENLFKEILNLVINNPDLTLISVNMGNLNNGYMWYIHYRSPESFIELYWISPIMDGDKIKFYVDPEFGQFFNIIIVAGNEYTANDFYAINEVISANMDGNDNVVFVDDEKEIYNIPCIKISKKFFSMKRRRIVIGVTGKTVIELLNKILISISTNQLIQFKELTEFHSFQSYMISYTIKDKKTEYDIVILDLVKLETSIFMDDFDDAYTLGVWASITKDKYVNLIRTLKPRYDVESYADYDKILAELGLM